MPIVHVNKLIILWILIIEVITWREKEALFNWKNIQ
jgi:hypothetical protein